MSSIDLLRVTAPHWASLSRPQRGEICLSAIAIRPSGEPGRTYALTISEQDGKVDVREQPDKKMLPSCCVERHINHDGTFCTFFGSTDTLTNEQAAKKWWYSLGGYLSDQDYASAKNEWPIHRGLSHGDAAIYQLRMEELATPLGWLRQIQNGMLKKVGWLGSDIPRVHRDSDKMVNQRSGCPRGCYYVHTPQTRKNCEGSICLAPCLKKHRSVLRTDCPNLETVSQLVALEHKRRFEETTVIRDLKNKDIVCCGSMNRCPLKKN